MPREKETGTCSVCRRRRQMVGPADPRPAWREEMEAMPQGVERRQMLDKINRHFHYFYLCRECTAMTPDERTEEMKRGEERVRERNLKQRKAYPVIGGPLDGEHALTIDFYAGWQAEAPGIYAHLANEYEEFNSASRGDPSMIFVHTSLLRRLIPGRDR